MDGKKNSIVTGYPSFPLEDSKSCPSNLLALESGFGNMYSGLEHPGLSFQASLGFSLHQNTHAALLVPPSSSSTLFGNHAICLRSAFHIQSNE